MIPQTRGKVLGGSSSVNGMLFVRGNRKNFDDWADEGCKGWSYEDVLPAFKRLEDLEDGANEFPVGTCRMGADERAVVGPDLKVGGIDGLRVADASIMPAVTGGNTNAPSLMIGERCADLILS